VVVSSFREVDENGNLETSNASLSQAGMSEPRDGAVWVLREQLGLTRTKDGCGKNRGGAGAWQVFFIDGVATPQLPASVSQ